MTYAARRSRQREPRAQVVLPPRTALSHRVSDSSNSDGQWSGTRRPSLSCRGAPHFVASLSQSVSAERPVCVSARIFQCLTNGGTGAAADFLNALDRTYLYAVSDREDTLACA